MHNPIFIIGAHKSGTTLLRNLLDDHDELYILPIEDHFFQHYGYWIDYPYRFQLTKEKNEKQIKDDLINWIIKCNNSSDKYADSDLKGFFNIDRFKEKIVSKNNLSTKDFLELYYESIFYSACGKEDKQKRFVSKSVENAELVLDIKKIFPNAKFIHIVRNPFAAFVGLRKYKSKNAIYPMIFKIVQTLYNSYYNLERNIRLIDDYCVIKYEDLLRETETTMKYVSDYLDISFTVGLTKPTVMGRPWGGNSTSDMKFTGVDTSPINNWEKEIKPFEVFLINQWFEAFLEKYEYDTFEMPGSIYRPMKGEGVFKYFVNRFFKYHYPLNK